MKTLLLLSLSLFLALPAAAAPPPPDIVDDLVLAAGAPAPSFALAQVEPAPATPAPPSFIAQILTPTNVMAVVAGVLGLVLTYLHLDDRRKNQIALAAYHAFHVVEDIAAETSTPIDDKAVPYLKALDDYFKANGWRALKPGEQQAALLEATALNGRTKLEEKVRAAAITGAASAVPPTA